MLLHNNGWEIERGLAHDAPARYGSQSDGSANTTAGTGASTSADTAAHHGTYWLIPPADIDPKRMPRLIPSRSAALRDLLAAESA